jgi:3-hydroxyacyl-CoA dehydrogenase
MFKKALDNIKTTVDMLIREGIKSYNRQNILKNIKTTSILAEGVKDSHFVIEAVSENIELKQKYLTTSENS